MRLITYSSVFSGISNTFTDKNSHYHTLLLAFDKCKEILAQCINKYSTTLFQDMEILKTKSFKDSKHLFAIIGRVG